MLEPNGGCCCAANSDVSGHVMIRIIGQLPGPHSLRKDLGTNRMSRRHRIRNGAARSVHPRGLDRSCHAGRSSPGSERVTLHVVEQVDQSAGRGTATLATLGVERQACDRLPIHGAT